MGNELKQCVEFRGVKISGVTYPQALRTITDCLERGDRGYVCLTDVGNVIAATKDPGLRRAINASMLSLADGTPLTWFAMLVGWPSIERISGMDIMTRLFQDAGSYRHFLLGDTEATIAQVIDKARQLNPRLQISGYSPPFREFSEEDNRDILARINDSGADIVWVCFGGGRQEKWMMEYHRKIDKGIMMGVGAAFRWFIGDIRPAPKIVQKAGLQWLFRMVSELRKDPSRAIVQICKRPLRRFPVFIAHFPFQVVAQRRRMKGWCLQRPAGS